MEDQRVGLVLDGRYRIEERVAAGGTGVVYSATQLGLGRPVAIKFLHQSSAASEVHQGRFKREAAAMSRINHPNVAAIIDFGSHEGAPYLVMELYDGRTLRQLIDSGDLELDRAIHIARQVLAGLAKAHEAKVVHRDLKPSNVLLVDSLDSDHVKILDFGVAKLTAGEGPTEASVAAGRPLGTPQYMSPEQAKAEAVDARSDLYSLGVLLYEMTTGKRPFDAGIGFALLRKQVEDEPSAPRELREMSEELEAVILRAMRKNPDDRFQSAAEMAEALSQVPEHARERAGSRSRGRGGVVIALLGVFAAAVAGVGVGAMQGWIAVPSWSPWQPADREDTPNPVAIPEVVPDAGVRAAPPPALPPWSPPPAEVELAVRPVYDKPVAPALRATVRGKAFRVASAALSVRGGGAVLRLFEEEVDRACGLVAGGRALELSLAGAGERKRLQGTRASARELILEGENIVLDSPWEIRILSADSDRGIARISALSRGDGFRFRGTFEAAVCPDPRTLPSDPPTVNGVVWDPDRAPEPDALPQEVAAGASGDTEFEVVEAHLTAADNPSRWVLSLFAEEPLAECSELEAGDVGAVVELSATALYEGLAYSAAVAPTTDGEVAALPRAGLQVRAGRTLQAIDFNTLSIHIDSMWRGEVRGRLYLAADDLDRSLIAGAFRARDCRGR